MVHTLRTIILPLMIFCQLKYVKMSHAGIFTQIRGHVRLHHRMIYVKRSLLWMIYADVLHYKYTLYVLIYRHFTVATVPNVTFLRLTKIILFTYAASRVFYDFRVDFYLRFFENIYCCYIISLEDFKSAFAITKP